MLSKSKLMAYRQCPRRLWLEVHKAELRDDSDTAQAGFQAGYQVGDAAKRIYDPDGLGVVIDVESEGFERAFERSAKLLGQARQPIFEAGFRANGALAFADVMLPEIEGANSAWRMIEVKSSTSVKDYHHDDIAVQTFVAISARVKLKSVVLAHIDSSWVYPGLGNYQGLLKENDLTAEAFARVDEVTRWIKEAHDILCREDAPEVAVGDQCSKPFECGFCSYCNSPKPRVEFPLDWLPRFSATKRDQLARLGVNDLRGVADDELSEQQALVKKHTLADSVFFDAAGAAADLKHHSFPAYFLDFESIQFAVPNWKGTRPYQQIVFQFSLHCLSESSQLSHASFLDLSGDDPSESLAKSLISACGRSGPVFVYNAAFETTRISELAERFPKIAATLLAINARVVDLLPIARTRYYHPRQQGSWSIKAVLPAIAPDLNYGQLKGVQDGGMAMNAFHEALQPSTRDVRKREIERQLLAYCRLDTFALVRLWEFFTGRNPSGMV